MLKEEIKRVQELLQKTNPLNTDYATYLSELAVLYKLAELEEAHLGENPVIRETLETIAKEMAKPFKETPEVIVETSPAEPVYTEVVPADLPPATLPEEPKKEAPTKEEVRALLAAKAKEGVVIEDVLAKYVPEGKPHKFSSIKAADYVAIVEELNHAG